MKITSIQEVKALLYKNSLRYHHITQNVVFNGLNEFKITLEYLDDEISLKIQNILKLGVNVKFELVDYY